MSKDYTWNHGSTSLQDEIPADSLPSRCALTGTGVIVRSVVGSQPSLLLCNPHPETWNSWMLPYGSLVIEEKIVQESGGTFALLTDRLVQLNREHSAEYEETALQQIEVLLGTKSLKCEPQAFFWNFSLKFSKSAEVWTAYSFAYHTCTLAADQSPRVASTWFPLNDGAIVEVLQRQELGGLSVADNVLALIKDEMALAHLRD